MVLRDGKIAQCAPPGDLYRRPVSAELAYFIGDANLLEGPGRGRREDDARLTLRAHGPVFGPAEREAIAMACRN